MLVLAGTENVIARVEASTTRVKAKSSAEAKFIELGKSQLAGVPPELANRALEYALGETVRTQQNREEILRIAAEHIAADPPQDDASEEIETDWLNAFKQYAETKSDSEIQQLWARILSSEIRSPGSASLRTLQFLSTVSSDEASLIVKLFNCTVDEQIAPAWMLEQKNFGAAERLLLEEIGITSDGGIGFLPSWTKPVSHQPSLPKPYSVMLRYRDVIAVIETHDEKFKIEFPVVPLSSVGKELYKITDQISPDYTCFKSFLLTLGKGPVSRISIGPVVPQPNGLVGVLPETLEEVFSKP